ncbi:MAG: peptidase C69, partial [Verrucomicrobia bacterium]
MIVAETEAKKMTAKVLGLTRADSCAVSVSGSERSNVRFAANSGTTNGFQDDLSLSIESNFGKRSGAVTINQLDDETVAAAMRRYEEIARLAPENPEFMPPLAKQFYLKGSSFYSNTAKIAPATLVSLCQPVIKESVARNVIAAGYLEAEVSFLAMATSNGLFVYDKSTGTDFTVTARTPDGSGSGWAGKNYHDIKRLDPERLGHIAVGKSLQSQQPVAMEPGKYAVILESSAVCDLVGSMVWGMDARQADEGRNFLTKKGGGN